MQKWFLTSAGNGDLSLTIKGILIGVIPLIIFIGQQFEIKLTQETLVQGIQLITELITAAIVFAGLVRKVANWAKSLLNK